MLCSRLAQKGTVDPEGNRVRFFGFPKDQNLRQEWLVKIRQDFVPHFILTEATKALHFLPIHVKKGIGGTKMALCKGAWPSRLAWRNSPRKCHPPVLRTTEVPRTKKRSLDEPQSQDNAKERDLSDSFSECTLESTSASPIETIKESRDLILIIKKIEIARLKEQSRHRKENLEKLELENEELKFRKFCLENMTEDYSISFSTGFPNMETVQATLTY